MRGRLIAIMLVSLTLSGCGMSQKDVWGWPRSHWKEQNFQPYLKGQPQSFPTVSGTESWAYPEGTPTAEITKRWRAASLISSVTNGGRTHIWKSPSNIMTVYVGPNFYNLSSSSQRGFADAIAQVYGVGQSGEQGGRNGYVLMDAGSGKPVGTYTAQGLQMY